MSFDNGLENDSRSLQYVIKQAKTKEEMSGIMDVIWKANYDPYDPVTQLFFPILGPTTADRESAVTESKERFWNSHLSDPSSHWFYVEDLITGKPVGCAQWQLFKTNPFRDGLPKLEAPWWPEKEHREFCELILNQIFKARGSWMRRPHLGMKPSFVCGRLILTGSAALNWMAVLPGHRRRGVGRMLMKWGVETADKLGIESWMEGSSLGRILYEKCGYRVLFKLTYDVTKREMTDRWRKITHELTPPPFHLMWRPANGAWEDARMPWELGSSIA